MKIGISFIGLTKTVWSKDLARFKLVEFTLNESGFSGSIGGKVSNSYIADALVYLDGNLNNQLDENEPITKTNSTGEFNLEFDLTEFDKNQNGILDEDEGQIIAFSGIDSSTGVPLATQLITGVDSAMITPLTNLQNFLVKEGYAKSDEAAEELIANRLGLSLKSLDIDLEAFDPLEALSSALVAEQEMGVDIYLAHVKVQNLMVHGGAFLQGLKPDLSATDIQASVTKVLAEALTSESGVFDLTETQQLQSFFNELADQTQKPVSPDVVALVAQTVATSNQTIDELAAEASDRTVEIVMQTVAPMKQAVQGEMAVITNNLTRGELTLAEAQQEYQDEIDASNFLVEQQLNDERTIKIYGTGEIQENSTANGEIIIELGEAVPNQGLNLLYSLSGTATLGEDYQFLDGNIGQIYIEPGETQAVFNITALDDLLIEGPETIVINLRYVGEGFQLDPEYQTALVTLTDDEPQSTSDASSAPLVTGTAGDDVFEGSEENDNYNGSYGDDEIFGNSGSDRLRGNYGDDTIKGGVGADILQGNYGDDNLEGNEGDDQIEGGDGSDILIGGEGNDQLDGQSGDDLLEGGKGSDLLEGGEGSDRLQGDRDNDWLLGGAGNDILIGGEGQDALNGGEGADRFVIALDSSIDNILDFDPLEGDKMVIDGSSFNTDNLEDFQFIGGYLYYQEQQIAAVQNDGKIYNTFSDLSQVLELVQDVATIEVPETAAPSPTSTAGLTQSAQPQGRNAEPQSTPYNFLEEILQRGYIKVGVFPNLPGFSEQTNGQWQGYSIDWGRALASALFGDPSKVEFVPQDGTNQTLENVANRQIDVATTNTTVLLYRDASLNIDYSPVHLYDTRAILVKADQKLDSVEDLNGLTIGVSNAFGLENLQNFMQQRGTEFTGKIFENPEEMYAAYERGEIDAVTGDRSRLKSTIPTLDEPTNHRILDEEITQEPLAMVLPENESEWADVVRWVTYTPMQAEEYGITSTNVDQVIANSTDPAIRRFLGLEGENGTALGVPNDFVVNTIKNVGNYGEIYERHFSGLDRYRNNLWSNEGLIYSLPFSGNRR